ncbi:MAG: hypothetical protein RTV72_09045 [Candidatus Thorarchaeota archaeon]
MTISRKKWGKSATKTEKIVRDAVPKPEVISGIDEYLGKARSVTCFDLANRFNIRMSVARKLLREKEAKGELVPYIREGGFVVYTTPTEMEKHEGGVQVMTSDVFEEIASSVTSRPVITEEMGEALIAAGTPGAVKPSKLTRQRRERGDRKERKDDRPEVVVQPLDATATPAPQPEPEPAIDEKKPAKKAPAKKTKAKKEEKPKKTAAKKPTKKEEKPKKAAAKKPTKKEEKPKKAATKKVTAKKEEKPKKTAAKKPAKKEDKPKKTAAKKPAKKEDKPKKAAAKKPAKKEEKPKKAATKK